MYHRYTIATEIRTDLYTTKFVLQEGYLYKKTSCVPSLEEEEEEDREEEDEEEEILMF